jgi:hypothetical protein
MSGQRAIGRVVLRVVIASLVVAGVVASVALVTGDLSDVDWRIIATSALLALASATVGAGLTVRPRHPALGGGTVAASVLAFALVAVGIWGDVDGAGFWRATGCAAIAALEGAHASFVLSRRRDADSPSTRATTRVAVAAAALSAAMGIAPLAVWPSVDDGVAIVYAQLLGVVLIVQLVCTAVAPLLRRLGAGAERPVGALPTPADRLADEITAVADRIERLAAQPQVAEECERLRRLAATARTS